VITPDGAKREQEGRVDRPSCRCIHARSGYFLIPCWKTASAFEAAWAATAPPAGRWQLTLERGRSLVTLAGHDLAGDADVALAASRVLSRSEIPVLGARVTPLSVSFLVPSERADDAMRRLHTEMIEKAGSGTPAR